MRQALIVAAFSAAFAAAALAQAAEQGDAGKKSAETAKTASSEPDGATETSGDWSIACSTPAGAAERVYEVNTAVLRRGQAMPFARIAVVRPAKDKPARVIALAPIMCRSARRSRSAEKREGWTSASRSSPAFRPPVSPKWS